MDDFVYFNKFHIVINIFKFSVKNLCSELKISSYFMQTNILSLPIYFILKKILLKI